MQNNNDDTFLKAIENKFLNINRVIQQKICNAVIFQPLVTNFCLYKLQCSITINLLYTDREFTKINQNEFKFQTHIFLRHQHHLYLLL